MNIFCLCVVRDEADVLPYTLNSARAWASRIFVTDNGSTDGTWEFLQGYAKAHPEVILCERDLGVFRPDRRGEMANEFIDHARKGDWWCRLDADEIYIDDPRAFLPRVRPRRHVVWSASVQYYFTDEDLRHYEMDPAAYTSRWDPSVCRYYQANWSEPRFIRHTPGRHWSGDWPVNYRWLRAAAERIRLRHFQYRSPPQIERRLKLRKPAPHGFRHEKGDGWLVGTLTRNDLLYPDWRGPDELWRTRVLKAAALHRDTGIEEPIVEPAVLPRVPGSIPSRALHRIGRMVVG